RDRSISERARAPSPSMDYGMNRGARGVKLLAMLSIATACGQTRESEAAPSQALTANKSASVSPSRRTAITEAVARVAPAVVTVQTEILQRVAPDPLIGPSVASSRSSDRPASEQASSSDRME